MEWLLVSLLLVIVIFTIGVIFVKYDVIQVDKCRILKRLKDSKCYRVVRWLL